MKFGTDLLFLYEIHSLVQFDPDRCMGGSGQNDKDFVFSSNTRAYHNPSYIQRISTISVANPYICVGSGLRCREKLGKFVSCNAGRTRTIDLNRGAFPVSCVQPKETFYGKPVAPMKSAHSEGVPFGGLNSSGIKEPKWAILNPRKFLNSRNLFHPSYLT